MAVAAVAMPRSTSAVLLGSYARIPGNRADALLASRSQRGLLASRPGDLHLTSGPCAQRRRFGGGYAEAAACPCLSLDLPKRWGGRLCVFPLGRSLVGSQVSLAGWVEQRCCRSGRVRGAPQALARSLVFALIRQRSARRDWRKWQWRGKPGALPPLRRGPRRIPPGVGRWRPEGARGAWPEERRSEVLRKRRRPPQLRRCVFDLCAVMAAVCMVGRPQLHQAGGECVAELLQNLHMAKLQGGGLGAGLSAGQTQPDRHE